MTCTNKDGQCEASWCNCDSAIPAVRSEPLLAVIKRYGEACEDYGMANPCYPAQCNRLAGEMKARWAEVVSAVNANAALTSADEGGVS